MTRINAGLHPRELLKVHLVAEWNEILRLGNLVKKHPTYEGVRSRIPPAFKLGEGHVLFFYDKLPYVWRRLSAIQVEGRIRGVKFNPMYLRVFEGVPEWCWWSNPSYRHSKLERDILLGRLLEKGFHSYKGLLGSDPPKL